MIVLSKWSAKRVSAWITIEGVDATSGRPVKVTKVGAIESGDPHPTARGYIKGMGGDQRIVLRP